MNAQLLLKTDAILGEGAIWDHAASLLYWVDIMGFNLHVFNPATETDLTIPMGEHIGTVVPWQPGIVVAALRERFVSVNLASGTIRTLLSLPTQQTPIRFNDGKCDPSGRFWAGTMSLNGQRNLGTLYSLDPQLQLAERLINVSTSNGIVWTADSRTMYYIDTPTGGADAFDFDISTGNITNRRRAVTFSPGQGRPDGMTIDEEGMLWIAHWNGSCVSRWNPSTGQQLLHIDLPVLHVTSCTFGGPALDKLYITTAVDRSNRTKIAYPLSGSLFVANTDVRGVPAIPFSAKP